MNKRIPESDNKLERKAQKGAAMRRCQTCKCTLPPAEQTWEICSACDRKKQERIKRHNHRSK